MPFSVLLIGHESLTVDAGTMLRNRGNSVAAVVSADAAVTRWATENDLPVIAPGPNLATRLAGFSFDWIVSAANLTLIPADVLAQARTGAVNFHDGPLPAYAGLNAPVWALLNGEAQHGVTWHLIDAGIDTGIDTGAIVAQRFFDIAPGDTAQSLNTKCYAAALDSFPDVIAALATGAPDARPQDLTHRSLFTRAARPAAAATIDPTAPTEATLRLVRALDHGGHDNPLALPKLATANGLFTVAAAQPAQGRGTPGAILSVTTDTLSVATADGAVTLTGLRPLHGDAVLPTDGIVPAPDTEMLTAAMIPAARAEPFWRARLLSLAPATLHLPGTGATTIALDVPSESARTALAILCERLGDGGPVDLALHLPSPAPGYISDWVPVRADTTGTFAEATASLARSIDAARTKGGFATDLPFRIANGTATQPAVGLSLTADPVPGCAITLVTGPDGPALTADPTRISATGHALLARRIEALLAPAIPPDTPCADLSLLPEAERQMMLADWNATETPFDAAPIPALVAAQVARTPEAKAVVHESTALTYAALDARANRVARVLRGMGVDRGSLVGLHLRRSADLIVAALAIHKAGGAYVPLDPGYPADRIALYLQDSGASVVITETAIADTLSHDGATLRIDTDPRIATAPDTAPEDGATADDLAYLIYTSGSTGRPKGVMVTHRNVANFFTGMDARIPHAPGDRWLAVTSLSFDISVPELFWTLTRGLTVVMSGDDSRTLVSNGPVASRGGMDFSLYYWGNDDGAGPDKYKLLLEGAKFADEHGFCAVWTPERHFHAFGGPYPNPSVTGAAVAAVTRNIGVRAGSCVGPLHHPARIAEEWAVIDNLTNGRAGLAIASGWQPDDFVLRPENAPPANKPAMFDTIATLRRLWAGDPVGFPTAKGDLHEVITQPRPVSKKLPIWVTTAGNPDTWKEAGAIGANVLTHLLGQSIAEVKDKIAIYHAALRDAGHDPADFTVTLMLHTYLAATREEARDTAREPMKDYLRSAAGLIKQYAWAFPAFKKPKGVSNAFQLDLGGLEEDELDAILDFAFERYFEDSGLFGTFEDAILRVSELKSIGVGEIACLIDYGIPVDTVLSGLRPLAQVLAQTNTATAPAEDDFSIAAQIVRHDVTHLQCTPSMARMLVTNDDSRAALRTLRHLMIGGEALPGALVADLNAATDATIENMYGPTETTIWSTTRTARAGDGVTGIGTPIANTQVYVLDPAMTSVPVGASGELWIGGDGVARGYWNRPDLTADRFRDNPFGPGKVYGTGDLVRWRPDGKLDFLGRADHQVKLRGYRIELGEVEAALDAVPGIAQAVVMAREDTPGNSQLVAYVTGPAVPSESALRGALTAALPPQMIPARIVTLDAFPLTPNKKVDRKALPAPTAILAAKPAPMNKAAAADPANTGPALPQITPIWERILGVTGISSRDNFFDLGGHSLLAVQAHREIRDSLGLRQLSITDIFRFPTLGALSARIDDFRAPVVPAPVIPAPAVPPAPSVTGPVPAPAPANDLGNDRANARADAMARRRALRARRTG